MSDQELEKEIVDYITTAGWAVIATVKDNRIPVLRTIGGFANEGLNVYFSTGKATAKVEQIEKNSTVAVLFQHEGQERSKFRYITITGEARLLKSSEELGYAAEVLGAKNPALRQKIQNEKDKIAVFRIETGVVKYLDFSLGQGPAAVREFVV